MRVLGLRVDGFGPLADFAIDDLSPSLSVVAGPNEAGKSTLLDFVRTVLFGFPDRRSRSDQHEPFRGGRHGGLLCVVDDNGIEWVIERYADVREPILTASDGRTGGESELRTLLGHTDVDVFRSVFAFGLRELGSLEELEKDKVSDLIFTAGVLGAGKSATAAIRALNDRRGTLVKARADSKANSLQKQRAAAEQALKESRGAANSYVARESDLRRLQATVDAANLRKTAAERQQAETKRLLDNYPIWNRLADASQRLAALGSPDDVEATLLAHEPQIVRLAEERSGHSERTKNLQRLRAHLGELEQSRRSLDLEWAQLNAGLPGAPEQPRRTLTELDQAKRSLQVLHGYISQRDQLIATRAQHDALELSARSMRRPSTSPLPIALLVGAFVVAIGGAVAGIARHQLALGVAAGVVAILLAVATATLARSRQISLPTDLAGQYSIPSGVDPERLAKEIARLANELGIATSPLPAEVETAADEVEAERVRRARLDDVTQKSNEVAMEMTRVGVAISEERAGIDSFEAEAHDLASLVGIGLDAPNVDLCAHLTAALVAAQSASSARARLTERLANARSDLTAAIGTSSEADRITKLLDEGDPVVWQSELASLGFEIEESDRTWQSARTAELDAARELDALATTAEVAALELQVGSLTAQLNETLKEWLTLSVAVHLLESTIDRYEQERQPAVIVRAGELFADVTGGRYTQLLAREDERSARHAIVAVSSQGQIVDSAALSRGTAEQLYLCLRLALAETHAERSIALPFVLDDVLVNFDPARASAVAQSIVATSLGHQVLAFTCHPHIVELFRAADPRCTIIELGRVGSDTSAESRS